MKLKCMGISAFMFHDDFTMFIHPDLYYFVVNSSKANFSKQV